MLSDPRVQETGNTIPCQGRPTRAVSRLRVLGGRLCIWISSCPEARGCGCMPRPPLRYVQIRKMTTTNQVTLSKSNLEDLEPFAIVRVSKKILVFSIPTIHVRIDIPAHEAHMKLHT